LSTSGTGVTGELPTKAGIVRATIVPGAARNQIQSVSFSGTFKAEPAGILAKLEQALGGSTIDEAPGKIEDFFAQYSWKSVTKTLSAATTESGGIIFVFCCIARDGACARC